MNKFYYSDDSICYDSKQDIHTCLCYGYQNICDWHNDWLIANWDFEKNDQKDIFDDEGGD